MYGNNFDDHAINKQLANLHTVPASTGRRLRIDGCVKQRQDETNVVKLCH